MTTIDHALEEAASLQSLIDTYVEAAPSKSGVARKAEIAEAISTKDIDELMRLQSRLSSIIATILDNTIDPDDDGKLSPEFLESLMQEHLDMADAKRVLDIRYALRRAAIFNHITAMNMERNLKDAWRQPGEVPVPGLHKKFVREGGRIKATINKTKLREQLGEKRWQQVVKAVVVPAVAEHIEYNLDEDAVLDLVQKDPSVMSIIEDCVIEGGMTPIRLMTRDWTEPSDD